MTRWVVLTGTVALVAGLAPAANAAPAPTSATDSFTRVVDNGLGTADRGGKYKTKKARSGTLSVNGSRAVARLQSGSSFETSLPSMKATDTSVRTVFKLKAMPRRGGVYYGVVARKTGNFYYRATVTTTSRGQVRLSVARFDGSTRNNVNLAKTAVLPWKYKAGRSFTLQMQVSGQSAVTISARAWISGSAAPAWQTTAVDTSSRRLTNAGNAGVWGYLSKYSSASTISFDNLRATSFQPVTAGPGPVVPPTAVTPPAPGADPQPTDPARRGADAPGTARYPVPAEAIFVSPRGSSEGDGSVDDPFGSVAAALASASSGSTIVLRAGTYTESVSTSSAKQLTIQNYPGEEAWFDGSVPVSSWTKSGSNWTSSGWSTQFDSNASFVQGTDQPERFVDPAHPMASHPDQVFIDGQALTQVAGAAAVKPGNFAVDYAEKTITIGDDPTGRSVRSSKLQTALLLLGPKSEVKGVGFRRYATSMAMGRGAVYVAGKADGSSLRNLTFEDNSTIGASIIKADVTMEKVTVRRSGLMGIGASKADRLVIKNSLIDQSNVERFKPQPAAGGIKITRQRGVTITNTTVSSSYNSIGIWTDESTVGIQITRSTVKNSGSIGIEVELSDDAIIADNISTGNKTGILVFDTGNVQIYNNYLGNNWFMGLKLAQDERRQASPTAVGRDPRRDYPDPTVPWINRNITIANNVFTGTGLFQFYALDGKTNIHTDSMVKQMQGNAFAAKIPDQNPTVIAWGSSDNKTLVRYQSAEEFAKAKSWVNSTVPGSLLSRHGSSLRAAVKGIDRTAVKLPADVAESIGQAAGSQRVGPYTDE
ncbi:MAG: right-handed parallel beta-helix repeat-containing protein [Kineosporiaceae bacterium]|nr:right-handed parallel beta-helix repeat-containing protein [Aeromicrobium sp.]